MKLLQRNQIIGGILGIFLTAGSASAALIIDGIPTLDPSTFNGGINPATSNPWAAGDTLNLAFVSSTTRNALSPDISDYHSFIQTAATNAGLGGVTWFNIGQSLNDPTRATNAPPMNTSNPIFLVDGTKLADNGSDLANGPDNFFNVTETGGTYNGSVATGSSRKFGDPNALRNGVPTIEHGASNRTDGAWWQVFNGAQASQWHFYGISEEVTVAELQVIPEPSSVALLGLGGIALLFRRRK